MAIEDLKRNLLAEKSVLRDISILASQLKNMDNFFPEEKRELEMKMLQLSINSLLEQFKIINHSTESLVLSLSPYPLISPEKRSPGYVKITYPVVEKEKLIVNEIYIKKDEKERFEKQFNISSEVLKRLRKTKDKEKKKKIENFVKTGGYASISNRLFFKASNKLVQKGYCQRVGVYLKKANMPYLPTTYLSISFMNSLIGLAASVFMFIASFFISLQLEYPFFKAAEIGIEYIFLNFLVMLMIPVSVFFMSYYYPYVEGKSIESRINRELPFVAVHMSAIAGSGIEPSQIFNIIAFGDEYVETKKELRKVINQVNLYGYDLVTSLKNTARETSSKKLAELLNGLAITISGGGSLPEFLNKRSETLLFEYKIDREKETKSAETFMNIYISVVITAPMILSLLLILISVSGIDIGIGINGLTVLILGAVSLINMVFLLYLYFKNTSY